MCIVYNDWRFAPCRSPLGPIAHSFVTIYFCCGAFSQLIVIILFWICLTCHIQQLSFTILCMLWFLLPENKDTQGHRWKSVQSSYQGKKQYTFLEADKKYWRQNVESADWDFCTLRILSLLADWRASCLSRQTRGPRIISPSKYWRLCHLHITAWGRLEGELQAWWGNVGEGGTAWANITSVGLKEVLFLSPCL